MPSADKYAASPAASARVKPLWSWRRYVARGSSLLDTAQHHERQRLQGNRVARVVSALALAHAGVPRVEDLRPALAPVRVARQREGDRLRAGVEQDREGVVPQRLAVAVDAEVVAVHEDAERLGVG